MKKTIKTQIEGLRDQIDAINAKRNNETLPLALELNAAFEKAFDASSLIQNLILSAEKSEDYGMNQYGELSQWVRIDVKALKEECLNDFDRLKDYLADHAVYLNLDDKAAEILVGDYVAITEDGDVYHYECGKHSVVVQRQDYNSKEEMNTAIQNFINSRGYINLYPLVVKVGRYGDVRVVSV